MNRHALADRWYLTSPFAAGLSGSVRTPDVRETVHAKELGTTRTVCGRPTETWHKFFDRSFVDSTELQRCPWCLIGIGHG